jgi:transposase
MGKQRKVYPREFKIEAVRLMEESELTTQQIADDLGISNSSLNRWRRELRADPDQAFPGNGKVKERDQEVAQLRRELHRVRQERDILKKTLAIFSRGPQ